MSYGSGSGPNYRRGESGEIGMKGYAGACNLSTAAVQARRAVAGLFIALLASVALSLPALGAGSENSLPPGTVITAKNWKQFSGFMPEGMQYLFSGAGAWKLPPDFRLEVGPTSSYPLPPTYLENTRKYSHLVKIKNLPNGGHTITGYVAGLPFPDPAAPLKGYKILVDFWYRYVPYLYCGSEDREYSVNSANQLTTARFEDVFRRLSHISDAGQPINDPRAQGIDYSQFTMTLEPEQQRYTTVLTLYYVDPAKPEDQFIFVPQLRRVLRGSSNSRCSPVNGTDFVPDDFTGFNGGIARFQADYLRDQRILALIDSDPHNYGQPANYYPLYLPKPVVGKWEVRDSYVIDTRRIPAERAGYCYGKQIMYIDKYSYVISWKDIYNPDFKLYKIQMSERIAAPIPGEGIQYSSGNGIEAMWDLQKRHLSVFLTASPDGRQLVSNEKCRNVDGVNYDDINRYSMPSGLTQVMR
jgi:Protein of unknown function (DUF1329)